MSASGPNLCAPDTASSEQFGCWVMSYGYSFEIPYLEYTVWNRATLPGLQEPISVSVFTRGMICASVCFLNGQGKYKFKAKELLKSGCNELLRPDILVAMYNSGMWSKVTICL